MVIQILEEYKSRIEYKVLKNYYDYNIVGTDNLKTGNLIIPGIILTKMSNEEIGRLNKWVENSNNQLILVPSWNEENLANYFDISIDIIIKRINGSFNDIPTIFVIESKAKEKIFSNDGKIYGLNYRKNLSSGLITVITLPLLDYKMLEFQEQFKELFREIIQQKIIIEESKENVKQELDIEEIHTFLIILCGANIDLTENLESSIQKYFGNKYTYSFINEKYNELLALKYIENSKLTTKGLKIVEDKKLKSFIEVVSERSEKENGWC